MRLVTILTGLFITLLVHAQPAEPPVLKQCSTSLTRFEDGQRVHFDIKVTAPSGDDHQASITTTADGSASEYTDVVQVVEESVRPGLTATSEPDALNQAEKLVVHAMILSEDAAFNGAYSSGIDLKAVRSATLYIIGEKVTIGSSTLVEARGENDEVLGTFFGGLLVSPCTP